MEVKAITKNVSADLWINQDLTKSCQNIAKSCQNTFSTKFANSKH